MPPGGAFTVLLLLWSTGASAVSGELELPPVDLREEDSGISVSFTNPLLFYRKLEQTATLKFTVSTDTRDFPSLCPVNEDVCRRVISLPAGEQKCVRVHRAFIGGSHRAAFRDTGRICLTGFPPVNLSLSCLGLRVEASWTSSLQRPQTFRVHVGGSAGHAVSETSERRFDLSRFVWASEERYMAVHFVSVAAVDGGSQSAPASRTFTFNDLRLAHYKCRLDFPPVDLLETDSGAVLSFRNPFHFYKELQEAVKPDTAEFSFSAASDAGDILGDCRATQEQCKLDIPFPADTEKCVRLKGALHEGIQVAVIVFNQTDRICARAPSEPHDLALALILIVVAIVVVVLVILICKAKAWTMKLPSPPEPLIEVKKRQEGVMKYAPVSRAEISDLTVNKPCKDLPVSSKEDQDLRERLQDPMEKLQDLPERLQDLPERLQDLPERLQDLPERLQPAAGLYHEGHLPDGYGGDEDSANSSMKTVSSDLEEVLGGEEEEVLEVRVYDRPQNLQVDMGDGEMVSAYMES